MPTFGYLPYQGWVFLFILLIIKHFPTFSFWGNYLLPIHNFTYIKANRTQSVKLRHPNWYILIHPSHDIFHLIMYHFNFIKVPTKLVIRTPQALGIASPTLGHCLPTAWALCAQYCCSANCSTSVDFPTRLAPLTSKAVLPLRSFFQANMRLYSFLLKITLITVSKLIV